MMMHDTLFRHRFIDQLNSDRFTSTARPSLLSRRHHRHPQLHSHLSKLVVLHLKALQNTSQELKPLLTCRYPKRRDRRWIPTARHRHRHQSSRRASALARVILLSLNDKRYLLCKNLHSGARRLIANTRCVGLIHKPNWTPMSATATRRSRTLYSSL